MADIQIPIGGELVSVPEWAKETTLQSLLSVIRANDQARNIVIKAMNMTAGDIKGLEDATDELKSVEKETAYNQARSIGDTVRGFTNRAVNTITALGDTSKPLSSVTNMAKQFKDTMAGADAKNQTAAKMIQRYSKISQGWSEGLVKGTGIAADAFLAYGGFLAAKIEQFAEAQATMIDSGAIFMQDAQQFQELREIAYQSGVSYNALTKTISKYGAGVASLGDGISGGSTVFAKTFNQLNRSADAYGDFGQTSQEMMDTYAGYIDVMRLTGQTDTLTANEGEGLQQGYTNLMLETSALAAATAFTRKQIIDTKFEAISDVDFAGPNRRIREKMGPEIANNLQSLKSTFALLGKASGTEGGLGKLGGMLEEMVVRAQQNMETTGTFTFGTTKQDRDVIAAFETIEGGPEFLLRLQRDIMNPNVKLNEMEIASRLGQLKVLEGGILKSDKSVTGTILTVNNELAGFQNANKKLVDMTEEERKELQDKTGKQLDAQGGVTQAINSAASLLLQAQEALTPNMVDMSKVVKNIADGLSITDELVTESERRKDLEGKISKVSDSFSKNKKAYDEGAVQAAYAMSGNSQALQSLIDEYVKNSGDIKDLDLPDGFTYKERFIGGYLGSKENVLVGEAGPEMLISDMPSYVKTIQQIARNLGDAIKTDVKDNGQVIEHYSDGYTLHRHDGGTDLIDKDGNILYNDSPTIKGYKRRTFSEGDFFELYETGAQGANITIHMFNGKRIGTEVESGDARVQVAGDGSAGSFVAVRSQVNDQFGFGAEALSMNGQTQTAGFIDNNMPTLSKPEGFDEDKEMMMKAMMPEGMEIPDQFGDTSEMAKLFKDALRNMTYNQRRQVVRSSAVYE
mgnify:CR=1 FL=1